MTQEEIQIYESCKKDLEQLKNWKEKLPFKSQNHGCGGNDLSIHFTLEKIHREMYNKVILSIDEAMKEINSIIEKL